MSRTVHVRHSPCGGTCEITSLTVLSDTQSYTGMGTAQVSCGGSCGCEEQEIDGMVRLAAGCVHTQFCIKPSELCLGPHVLDVQLGDVGSRHVNQSSVCLVSDA